MDVPGIHGKMYMCLYIHIYIYIYKWVDLKNYRPLLAISYMTALNFILGGAKTGTPILEAAHICTHVSFVSIGLFMCLYIHTAFSQEGTNGFHILENDRADFEGCVAHGGHADNSGSNWSKIWSLSKL